MLKNLLTLIKDKSRTAELAVLAVLGGAVVFWIAPHQLEVILYKGVILSGSAFLGYWIDRLVYPYARPDQVDAEAHFNHAALRRAIIIGATILAGAIAL